MNKFFNQYADLTALAITLLFPFIATVVIKRKAGKNVRAVPAYFLLFGPCGILSFIFFHLFENSYRAIEGIVAGSFIYTFHFYSLILLGVVIAWLGIRYFIACKQTCIGSTRHNKPVIQTIVLIAFISGPLIPITPISAVPLICSVISLAGLPFVRRKTKTILGSATEAGWLTAAG